MKITCINNKGLSLPKDCIDKNAGFSTKTVFNIVIGKEYIVYGITLYLGHLWYYICDEGYSYYPIWNPSSLFKVTDNKISRYWVYNYRPGSALHSEQILFTFPEWATDPYFYDQLTDGENKYKSIFAKYKKLMDLEFPDKMISQKAILLDKNWVMCPLCNESWKTNEISSMVECPKCNSVMHNPLNS